MFTVAPVDYDVNIILFPTVTICYHFNSILSLALISQSTHRGFGGFVCLVFFGFSVCQQTIHSLTLLLKIKINSNST